MLHLNSVLTALTIHSLFSGLALTAQTFACSVGLVSALAMVLLGNRNLHCQRKLFRNCLGVKQAKQLRCM